jgi:hypothetical protein
MKKFDKKLKAFSSKLHEYEPRADVWNSIDKQLNFHKQLSSFSEKLPIHEPRENFWDEIEIKLKPAREIFRIRKTASVLTAAATIAFLLGTWFYIDIRNEENLTITVETLYDNQQFEMNTNDSLSVKAKEFISEQCRSRSYICEVPEFKAKKQQLEELEMQVKEVDKIINQTGSSPSLIKTRVKLENMRSRLMKEIINMITS